MKVKTDLFIFFLIFPFIFSTCPNNCNQNGYCSNGVCECFPSYHGIDCSTRVCPSGTAWFDEPSASNVAHGSFRECSNMVYYFIILFITLLLCFFSLIFIILGNL